MRKASVASATHNAQVNEIENCNFVAGDSTEIFDAALPAGMDPANTVVIIDPPRKGCGALLSLSANAP
jgi:tRNA (uracil-5-)-methyltransferase